MHISSLSLTLYQNQKRKGENFLNRDIFTAIIPPYNNYNYKYHSSLPQCKGHINNSHTVITKSTSLGQNYLNDRLFHVTFTQIDKCAIPSSLPTRNGTRNAPFPPCDFVGTHSESTFPPSPAPVIARAFVIPAMTKGTTEDAVGGPSERLTRHSVALLPSLSWRFVRTEL